jgi:hypothetical protein
VRLGRLGQLRREDAGLDPGDPGVGVDLDPPHPLGLQQDRLVEVGEGAGAVAGSLSRDLQPVRRGEGQRGGYVVSACGEDHRGGPLVDCQVPGGARLVPVRVA